MIRTVLFSDQSLTPSRSKGSGTPRAQSTGALAVGPYRQRRSWRIAAAARDSVGAPGCTGPGLRPWCTLASRPSQIGAPLSPKQAVRRQRRVGSLQQSSCPWLGAPSCWLPSSPLSSTAMAGDGAAKPTLEMPAKSSAAISSAKRYPFISASLYPLLNPCFGRSPQAWSTSLYRAAFHLRTASARGNGFASHSCRGARLRCYERRDQNAVGLCPQGW